MVAAVGFVGVLAAQFGAAVSRRVAPVICRAGKESARGAVHAAGGVPARGLQAEVKGDVRSPLRELVTEPQKDEDGRIILKSMTRKELEVWCESIGEKKFRGRQLHEWMFKKRAATFDEMTDLAKTFRERLKEIARIDALEVVGVHTATDGTQKIQFKLSGAGGGVIESVIIPAKDRVTLCISSQLGCAMNCQFCFTARMGLHRHLTLAEIVDQVVIAKRMQGDENPITGVVWMGLGEPLHNLQNVMRAVEVLLDEKGLNFSHNKLTVSTSGLVPEIRQFVRQSKANLAVSLNATTDEVRNWIMPINRKYNLDSLMTVLREEFPRDVARQHKVFFEYVCLKDVNDSIEDAKRILQLTANIPCKINLIHFNPHPGTEFVPSPPERMAAIQEYLVKKGMVVTIRQSRGDEKMMACGQLGKPGEKVPPPRMKVPVNFKDSVLLSSSDDNAGQTQKVGI